MAGSLFKDEGQNYKENLAGVKGWVSWWRRGVWRRESESDSVLGRDEGDGGGE